MRLRRSWARAQRREILLEPGVPELVDAAGLSEDALAMRVVEERAPARSGDPQRCRPIGCYEASPALAAQYRKDRR